jgi:hypothetical protein
MGFYFQKLLKQGYVPRWVKLKVQTFTGVITNWLLAMKDPFYKWQYIFSLSCGLFFLY